MDSSRNGGCQPVRRHGAAAQGVRTGQHSPAAGFTLVELLVVIALIAVLACIHLPGLAAIPKISTQATMCSLNTRQLTLAWTMYTADNNDHLLPNGFAGSWVPNSPYLGWGTSTANTNWSVLVDPSKTLLAAYLKDPRVYKCPSDGYAAQNGPRVRSYSLSADLGGQPTDVGNDPQGRVFTFGTSRTGAMTVQDLKKPGPANIFTFLDEHGDSIDDGVFHIDPGQAPGSVYWRNLPANYHNGAYSAGFADGHSQVVRLQQRITTTRARTSLLPVIPSNAFLFANNYNGSPFFSGGHYNVIISPDYNQLVNEEPCQ